MKHYYVEKYGRTVSDYDNITAAVKHAESIGGTVMVQDVDD